MSTAPPEAAITATGTDPINADGVAISITVFSSVKWWGRLFLPVLFFVTARIPKLTVALRTLSFIHFARWSVFTKIPYNGPPQHKRRLRTAHMYFESNFNGGWEEYIDAFSHILAKGMSSFWGSSFGFPKPLPTAPFKAYITENETAASHYYSAYPAATATMAKAALRLDEKLGPLTSGAAQMSPKAFQAAYAKLLTDTQDCL